MFVEAIELKNFRCFAEANLRLGKITLLLGPNSAGKSSLLYGLLAAVQSEHFPLYFSPNGNHVQLGDFESIVFRHRKKLPITVRFKFSGIAAGPSGNRPTDAVIGGTYVNSPLHTPALSSAEYDSEAFSLSVGRKRFAWRLDRSNQERPSPVDESLSQLMASVSAVMEQLDRPKVRKGEAASRRKLPAPNRGSHIISKSADYDDAVYTAASGNPALLRALTRAPLVMSMFGASLNYISSFRNAPERTYYQAAQSTSRIGKFGERYIDQIAEWQYAKADEFGELVSHLRAMQLLADMRLKRMAGGRMEVLVKASKSGVQASLADVGFGLSQFIPILVADLQLGGRSTLAISQPEIHLHPSVQAAVANYFVESVEREKKRYIVETHSEYLVNRLRLLVVEGHIKEEDLSVAYLESTRNGVRLHEIRFMADGRIVGAPDEYFRTYMTDVMDIAMKATK